MEKIRGYSIWRFIGERGRRGLKHMITSFEGDEVVTWSEPVNASSGGDTWMGPIELFFQEFEPVS